MLGSGKGQRPLKDYRQRAWGTGTLLAFLCRPRRSPQRCKVFPTRTRELQRQQQVGRQQLGGRGLGYVTANSSCN